ncbi:hypothetical protein NliqN6_5713 [Naganishia liquefaciens]|uniref:Uncharacterized protein n=1 Tax=Naganishia liquefaciens TaxID=104408 RepID=A0A8H3TXB8_9TREE|nr:hypothetical protein NliqN6_5713 [Naganishia liquefaciens]
MCEKLGPPPPRGLTEYVTIVVLLGATVVAFPDALFDTEADPDPDPDADAVGEDDPEDAACDPLELPDGDTDEEEADSWACARLVITTRRARMANR